MSFSQSQRPARTSPPQQPSLPGVKIELEPELELQLIGKSAPEVLQMARLYFRWSTNAAQVEGMHRGEPSYPVTNWDHSISRLLFVLGR